MTDREQRRQPTKPRHVAFALVGLAFAYCLDMRVPIQRKKTMTATIRANPSITYTALIW